MNEMPEATPNQRQANLAIETAFAAQRETAIALRASTAPTRIAKLRRLEAEVLANRGAAPHDLEVVWVPGSFELPLACHWVASSGRYDAVLALGVLATLALST